jgi:hypothetical protein
MAVLFHGNEKGEENPQFWIPALNVPTNLLIGLSRNQRRMSGA